MNVMHRPPVRTALPLTSLVLGALLVYGLPANAQAPDDAPERVAALFAEWDSDQAPGCAAGVSQRGERLLTEAWGMAHLEWRIRNAPGTIFENGSVSKQFTAAAVILLAMDGALDLNDDIRTYIPEVPDYGSTITITHLMNHTSGLRDWGAVAGISGWGRSARTHSHDHVLEIISRQSALNFEPGKEYSYSNSGYNLMAILVERVSGQSFADFSRDRVFNPAGMMDTQWRDDYTRIVPGRSQAYSRSGDGFRINNPIENVHGNGGLLTTVHDLLTWNEALAAEVFGVEFNRHMRENGVLNDGRSIRYARGVSVGPVLGVTGVTHTGATSGFRAYLGYFPDHDLSVAVLCNVANVNPGGLGTQIAAIYLGDAMQAASPPAATMDLNDEQLSGWGGLYREEQTGQVQRVGVSGGSLRWAGTALVPLRGSAEAPILAVGTSGHEVHFSMQGGEASVVRMDGGIEVDRFTRVSPVTDADLTPSDLSDYVGTWWAEDAETEVRVDVSEGGLWMTRRPERTSQMRPIYRDAFTSPIGTIRFLRDASGRVTGMTLFQARVYDMRFERR